MFPRFYLHIMAAMALFCQSCQPLNSHHSYFNQKPPDSKPALFAPGLVNTQAIEINAVFNTSFTELFFTRIENGKFNIHHSELIEGGWTHPEPIQLYEDRQNSSVAIDPSISMDGRTMYFLGINPEDRAQGSPPDIYRSQKEGGKWQLASRVGYPVSTEFAESYPVVVADGSLYFESDRPGGFGKRDIYRAQYLGDGEFEVPINLGPTVNSAETARSTYVSPDESLMIFTRTSAEKPGFDVSFNMDGQWQTPEYLDLGASIEPEWIYFCPYLTPDNQYFFYSRRYSEPPESGWKGIAKGEVLWVKIDLESIKKSRADG